MFVVTVRAHPSARVTVERGFERLNARSQDAHVEIAKETNIARAVEGAGGSRCLHATRCSDPATDRTGLHPPCVPRRAQRSARDPRVARLAWHHSPAAGCRRAIHRRPCPRQAGSIAVPLPAAAPRPPTAFARRSAGCICRSFLGNGRLPQRIKKKKPLWVSYCGLGVALEVKGGCVRGQVHAFSSNKKIGLVDPGSKSF